MAEHAPATLVWQEERKVRAYDVDFRRCATLETVCRWFLDAAWNHAELLGVGYRALAAQAKVWVLSRLIVEIRQFPAWGDAVTLQTWALGVKSLFAMRDFELREAGGGRLLAGRSAWLVLDANTRRPQRAEKLLSRVVSFAERQALEREPEKLPACGASSESFTTVVRYHDVDVNGHVNSARYVGWLLDAYPMEFHRAHAPTELEINYLGETLGGDTVTLLTQAMGQGVYHHGILKTDGTEVVRARLKWRSTEPVG